MADYDISQAFKAIENELIDSMMRNFSRHRAEETKEGYNWSQWQAEQLKSLEQYRKRNIKKFNKQFSEINSKISEMLKTARADGSASQEAKILTAIKNGFNGPSKPSANSTAEFFKVNDRKLNALIKSTTDDLKRAETAILRMSNDKYRKAIFNAQVYANTGVGTYEKAVDMACRDMLKAGINCIEYKNGARHTLPDYAEMAIRTANKRAYLYGEGEKRAEWGISTVVVNQRQGGCPDCAQYIGQVFIDDVYSNGKEADGNYPLLSEAIVGGLFHPRCKDSTSTYYEGITTLKKVSKSELSEMKENEALEQQKANAENQAEKCNRIAKYSLDKDNKRIYQSRAEKWQEKADKISGKVDNSVANSPESGIIKEQSKKSITKITDKTISRVPKVSISQYSDDKLSFIQEQHKELLRVAKNKNNNNEVAFVFINDFKSKNIILGSETGVEFGTLGGRDLFVMHNHPRNSSFSFDDLVEFIGNKAIKSLSIVKNNGGVEVLTKTKDYSTLNLLTELSRLEKRNVKTGSNAEYRKIIDKFIKKYNEMGVIEWLK